MDCKTQIALMSGRFDPPHLGHLVNLQRMGAKYGKVIVPILDYPERKYPTQYCKQVLVDALSRSIGLYEVFINKHHFAKITAEQLLEYPSFDVYIAAGNMEVIRNMAGLGYKIEYLDRAYHYEATDQRIVDGLKELLK